MALLVIATSLYILIAAVMYIFQRQLQYFPSPTEVTPESVGLTGIETVHITTPDGEKLLAWHAPAKPGQPTLLYLHGNGGGISGRPLKIKSFADRGFGVLALSYRGYEGSTGSPSEPGLITDGLAAYDWLVGQGINGNNIMLLGESLGTGVAVRVAAQRQVAAIALEAPYSSTASVAAQVYWFLPVKLLMKDQFNSLAYIGKVKAPLLIQHGKRDEVIPYDEGQRLFSAANEPKQMLSYDELGHDLISVEKTWAIEADFFAAHRQP